MNVIRTAAIAVTATLLLTAAACSHDAGPVAKAAGSLTDETRALMSAFGHDSTDVKSLTSTTDHVSGWGSRLDTAAQSATGPDRDAIVAAIGADVAMLAAQNTGRTNATLLDVQGLIAATTAARGTGISAAEQSEFEKVSRKLAKEIGCGIVWQAMTDNEHASIQTDVDSHAVTVAVQALPEVTADAVKTELLSLLAGRVSAGFGNVVDLATYANDVTEKAQTVVDRVAPGTSNKLSDTITTPAGATTRAFYEYTQQCLAPPKPE